MTVDSEIKLSTPWVLSGRYIVLEISDRSTLVPIKYNAEGLKTVKNSCATPIVIGYIAFSNKSRYTPFKLSFEIKETK